MNLNEKVARKFQVSKVGVHFMSFLNVAHAIGNVTSHKCRLLSVLS